MADLLAHPAAAEFQKVRDDLLVEFQTGEIPLAECCDKYFGLSLATARTLAQQNRLVVPAHRIGSRKAPWLVRIDDLAHLIIQRRREAAELWSVAQ